MKTVATFDIKYQQYLDPEAKLVQKELPKFAKDKDELLKMYRMMSFVRVFDTKSIALQRTGKLGTYACCLGHEAAHVGIGSAMKPEDVFFPSYREYGAQICIAACSRARSYMYWGGDERGNHFSEGPRTHDFAWSRADRHPVSHAAGAATAVQDAQGEACGGAPIGDGGISKGDLLRSHQLRRRQNLPLVFVIVNNQWAISVPRSSRPPRPTLAQKGVAGGLVLHPGGRQRHHRRARGMEDALEKARSRQGPARDRSSDLSSR